MYTLSFLNIGMRTSATQWGNSLAVRIPKPFAEQLGIKNGTIVEMVINNKEIVMSKSKESLEGLMEKVNPENLHEETDTGIIKGNEIW